MSDNDSADSAQLAARRRVLSVAILLWLVVAMVPLVIDLEGFQLPFGLAGLFVLFLIPAAGFYLASAFLCKERPGLGAIVIVGALLLALIVVHCREAVHDVHYTGWRPVVWVGLMALAQLSVILAAGRAWLVAPSADGPFPHLKAIAAAVAPFLVWWALRPLQGMHSPIQRNESQAIGDIRTLLSAEAAYQIVNGDFFDTPECLATPQRCIPAYSANAPTFIDSRLGQKTDGDRGYRGYRRVFHAGPTADPAAIRRAKASPSSLMSFAYVAVPVPFGRAGVRAFCGDATGRICFTQDGRAPGVEQGLCAASCATLP